MKSIKILNIITRKKGCKENSSTIDSLKASYKKEEQNFVTVEYDDEISEAKAINDIVSNTENIDYICIIPEGSIVSKNYEKIIKLYIKDLSAVYLPIVSYCYNEEDPEKEIFKGFLNTIMWKAHLAKELGEMKLDLSLKQADTSLYFSLIPLDLLKEEKLAEDYKYFSHFEYLNRILSKEKKVFGIQKVCATLLKDYELKGENKDLKREEFERARKTYLEKE